MLAHVERMAVTYKQQWQLVKDSNEHVLGVLAETRQHTTGVQQRLAEATAEKVAAAVAVEMMLKKHEVDLDEVRVCLESVSCDSSVPESTLRHVDLELPMPHWVRWACLCLQLHVCTT